jgi:hypothetical protein
MSEQCENCGQLIGALETPHVHEDHVVCRQCKDKLSGARPPILPAVARPVAVARAAALPMAGIAPGHVPYAPQVNVHLPQRASSLGITSLILGVVAFCFCWIPFIGMLTIPVSLLGVIFGSMGIVIAGRRQWSGIGFPIAGLVMGLFALVIGLAPIVIIGAIAHAIPSPPAHQSNFSWPQVSPQPFAPRSNLGRGLRSGRP